MKIGNLLNNSELNIGIQTFILKLKTDNIINKYSLNNY